jgi:hypothetical protein
VCVGLANLSVVWSSYLNAKSSFPRPTSSPDTFLFPAPLSTWRSHQDMLAAILVALYSFPWYYISLVWLYVLFEFCKQAARYAPENERGGRTASCDTAPGCVCPLSARQGFSPPRHGSRPQLPSLSYSSSGPASFGSVSSPPPPP